MLIAIVLVASLSVYNFQYVSGDGAYNYALNPTTSSGGGVATELFANASISQTISGTSTYPFGPMNCSSSVNYLWGYQNNVLDSSSYNNTWIQEALIVGNNASCFTIEDWSNVLVDNNPTSSIGSMVTSYPNFWNSSGTTVSFGIEGISGATASNDSVFDFVLTGQNISTSVTDYIYPGTMPGNPTIVYSNTSQQNFILVASCCSLSATFTQGYGTITYSGVSSFTGTCYTSTGGGGINGYCYQSGETGNMNYGNIDSNHVQTFGLQTEVLQTAHNSGLGTTSVSISILPDSTSDYLFLGVGDNEGPVTGVSWSASPTWIELTDGSSSGAVDGYASIWYASVPSGITSSISITASGFSGSGAADLFLWEVTNVNITLINTPVVTTGNYYSEPNVTAFSTFPNGFLMGTFGDGVGCQPTITGGSGFTFISGSWRAGGEYIAPFSGSSSTIPFGGYFQCSGGLSPSYTWVEVGVSLQPA